MGHAVMGTAVRSGDNRAIEAAQAAMASPLLEAGAIDGARGILINITGSSSLKLSEVNEASSLIQSAAHEDANIIFGAVLDEQMGDEVKITVIATGFRDQMPERRARMLSVEEAPVVSVPVEAPVNWLREPIQPVPAAPEPEPEPAAMLLPAEPIAPPRPRFLSEDEDPEAGEAAYFVSSTSTAVADDIDLDEEEDEEMELVAAPARPKFAELEEPSPYTPLPRDFASDFVAPERAPTEKPATRMEAPADDVDRDLDVPTFMRRLQF